MMSRETLYASWRDFYARGCWRLSLAKDARDPGLREELRRRILFLVGRMRMLGALPQLEYHGYNRRSLQAGIGMSLGVHQQLLVGLTSVPGGGRLKGGGGV